MASIEKVNSVLSQIRHVMEETMNTADDSVAQGQPGTGQAVNALPGNDYFDMYLSSIVDLLMQELDLTDEDRAIDLVFYIAKDLESTGVLPPMPSADAPEDEIAVWLGKAKGIGFGAQVLQMSHTANAQV